MGAPIISSEGLLRLVELVERLKARDLGEGGTSWTTPARTSSPGTGADGGPGGGSVDVVAAGQSARCAQDLEHAAGSGDDLDGGQGERRRKQR
jgi:hypothetical protein